MGACVGPQCQVLDYGCLCSEIVFVVLDIAYV